ncbi:hypothetical protein GCM10010349_13530 [Streptomyces flavofungini]|nr:hypothetical protein GCM10010349_13530 [Streptomyces flavofungini]
MSAVTRTAPAPGPAGGIGKSVRDSLVIARRNLIRMSRIPNPVGAASLSCDSPHSSPSSMAAACGGTPLVRSR